MKKNIVPLLLMLALSMPCFAGGNRSAVETAQTFFTAVKTGDVVSLQQLIGAPLSEQIGNLLTNNLEYPDFLRAHYEGASAEVDAVNKVGKGDKQVDLIITFADNRVSLIKLTLSRKKSGKWKVIEQKEVLE